MTRLSALKARAISTPGRHSDGDGLMLVVKEGGSKSWLLRIQHQGMRRDIGLGSFKDVSLAEARERAAYLRKASRSGVDPLEAKQALRRKAAVTPTFQVAAILVHEQRKEGWSNGKHQDQWLSSLQQHAFPSIGGLGIDKIDAGMVISLLEPIWLRTPETARRVMQRIGIVLDWGFSMGFREAEAPMRAIGRGLPRQLKRDNHFAALPYKDVPALLSKLGKLGSTGSMALRFLLHTAARSGEVRGATWGEIDWREETWVIPAKRMKAGKEHVVPLNKSAMAILLEMRPDITLSPADRIFPGLRGSLSDMTLGKVLKAQVQKPATVHGLRSSFRDWAAEQTNFSGEVVEAALAHTVRNKVEAAYRRTNYLEKRRALMEDWDKYNETAMRLIERDAAIAAKKRRPHTEASPPMPLLMSGIG